MRLVKKLRAVTWVSLFSLLSAHVLLNPSPALGMPNFSAAQTPRQRLRPTPKRMPPLKGTGRRQAGILHHMSQLPGEHGVGDMGQAAKDFVDWAARAGFKKWQVLGMGPTSYGDSPYQAQSTFAGNPNFINLNQLVAKGWLTEGNLRHVRVGDQELDVYAPVGDKVDYGKLFQTRAPLFKIAYENFKASPGDAGERFEAFKREHDGTWLHDWALYAAIKADNGHREWKKWPSALRNRKPEALATAETNLEQEIETHKFVQFLYFEQWHDLKRHANAKGLELIGDIPIYLAEDSAEVWANQKLFKRGVVAGVPPDYFSKTGQRWGNPIYDWAGNWEGVTAFWKKRLVHQRKQFDEVKIDHFRGFTAYDEIPSRNKTAMKRNKRGSEWTRGPARLHPDQPLFGLLKEAVEEAGIDGMGILAENLGVITPPVENERRTWGFPGMLVAQFGLHRKNAHHGLDQFSPDAYGYAGTHDNVTTMEWYESATPRQRRAAERNVHRFLRSRGHTPTGEFARDLDVAVLLTNAETAILRTQDILGVGAKGTMNRPGKKSGNWQWRPEEGALTPELADELRALLESASRLEQTAVH